MGIWRSKKLNFISEIPGDGGTFILPKMCNDVDVDGAFVFRLMLLERDTTICYQNAKVDSFKSVDVAAVSALFHTSRISADRERGRGRKL